MVRHSKQNTKTAYFSHREREICDVKSTKMRVSSDGFKSFDSCTLCLRPLREPMSWSVQSINFITLLLLSIFYDLFVVAKDIYFVKNAFLRIYSPRKRQ